MTERSFWWETNDTGDGPAAGYSQENLFSMWRMFAQGANAGGIFPDYLNMLEVSGSTSPIDVDNGAAIVYGSPYENTSAKTVVIPTPAGDTRVDRIVLRMSWSAQTVRITRIAGSEGSGAPALVQNAGTTWDIPLALAIIDTGGTIVVTDEREWITPVGAGAILNAMLADGAVSDAKFTGQLSPVKGGTGVNNSANELTIPETGTAVLTTATQTLTNKTLTAPVLGGTITGTYTLGGTPTFPSNVVLTTATQTLTNKTLTAPTISGTGFTNAQHAHSGATSGGQLSLANAVTGILPSANGGTGINNGGRTLTINTNNGTLGFVTANGDLSIHGVRVGRGAGSEATNTTVGNDSLTANTTGARNTAIGEKALKANTSGASNTAVGESAATAVTFGEFNTAIGRHALNTSTGANSNTAVGAQALRDSSGGLNTALGALAGDFVSTITGNNNTFVGYASQPASASASNVITLGNSDIETLRCQQTSITALSDRRDKTDINPVPVGLDFINALNPVRFTWAMRDGGKQGIVETGFIAQDLQEATAQFDADYLNLVYDENPDKLEATPGNLIPVLVKAIQELTERVEQLES